MGRRGRESSAERRHREILRWAKIGALPALVSVLVTIATIVLRDSGPAPPTPPPDVQASGNIVDPQPGQAVVSPIDVRGVASTLEDQVLWVLVKPRNNHYYTVTTDPGPVDVDARGKWIVRTVGLGKGAKDKGKPYDLVLVVAPRAGSELADAVARKGSRMAADLGQQLPIDTQELDRVTVTLVG